MRSELTKRALGLALILLVALSGASAAQQVVSVGDNANILPIYKSTPDGLPPAPDDYLRGNILGQRCNEASIGVSPIDRDTMMVFCNDYRATFNFDDALAPAGKTSFASAVWNGIKTFLARLTGKSGSARAERRVEASSEAGVGGGITYDGGLTYVGFMVPGGPNDSSPASLTHPGKLLGLTGYSDPFAVSWRGRSGEAFIGVAYIGFNREPSSGNPSAVFFTVYQDLNNSDTVHNIVHVRDSVVNSSNNLKQGQFRDKVWATSATDGCLYISHTRFTGSAGSSNIYLSKSCDDGATWTATAVDQNSKYGQGSAVFANPTDATKLGVLWRTFGTTSSLVFKSISKNARNVDLFASDPDGAYRPFDQYSQPLVVPGTNPPVDDKNRVAFRTLAFPWGAYTPDGTLVVVFTEWIDLSTGKPPTSTPGPLMPLTVMKYSTDNGATWSPRQVLNWQNGEGALVPGAPDRLGFFSPERRVGAQFQPAIACAPGNVCAVVWKQAYEWALNPGGLENPGSYVMAGFDRRFDVRGVLLTFPTNGGPEVSSSYQVSRYGYRQPAKLNGTFETPGNVSDFDDSGELSVDWVDKMTLPNGTTYPIWNFDNTNHTGGGLQAFTGDYIGVKDLTTPGEAPRFMVAFSDTRYNIRAWQGPTGAAGTPGNEPSNYRYFQAPTAQAPYSCLNYGSRVQSVMTARIDAAKLMISAQTNQKPFQSDQNPPRCGNGTQACIEFPITIWNTTGEYLKAVSLTLTGSGSPFASFVKRPYNPAIDGTVPYIYPLVLGSVEIYPYGSYSTVVYAFSGSAVTVTAATQGATPATITLNDPNVASASGAPSYEYVPSTINLASAGTRSAGTRSAGTRSAGTRSAGTRSYPVPDDPVPGQTVYDVIDQTYVVTPNSSDDAGTYQSLFNIDPAYEGNYVFQVLVTKPLTSFMFDKTDPCSAFNFAEGALVGHISDPSNPLVAGTRSAGTRSAGTRSAGTRSVIPSDGDPLVQNTTFTLGSSTELATAGTSGTSTQAAVPTTGCRIDLCTLAAPRLPNEVTILVRAYQIRPTSEIPSDRQYDPDGSRTGTATPLSVAVADYSCDDPSCTVAMGPDLIVPAPPTTPTPVSPRRLRAGGEVAFPTIDIKNEGVDGDCGTLEYPVSCGEAHPHQWAVYASTEPDFEMLPRNQGDLGKISGTIKENTDPTKGPITVLLKTGDHPKVPHNGSEQAVVGNITIPSTIPRTNPDGTGTYYLHFYDDSGRVVNELDELNNDWSDGPIIVDAPGYGFLGLQTPCSGMTCDKTGTLPLAWQFTSGSVAVNSVSTLPRVRFYDACEPAQNGYPAGTLMASSEPTAADITSGASGWQYFPNTGMARPQYTWQLNFDATGLPRGYCYGMYIEVPGTGQVFGSTDPQLKPFGPFYITPR